MTRHAEIAAQPWARYVTSPRRRRPQTPPQCATSIEPNDQALRGYRTHLVCKVSRDDYSLIILGSRVFRCPSQPLTGAAMTGRGQGEPEALTACRPGRRRQL